MSTKSVVFWLLLASLVVLTTSRHGGHGQGFTRNSESQLTPIYEDCSEVRQLGEQSGLYRIRLNKKVITVYCDFDAPGGDWLVFQRRRDGSVNFLRKWYDYTNGFGDIAGDFWLGNEILHQLTSTGKYKLRVDLEDFEDQRRFAEYSSFSVGPSSDNYRLKIGRYSGNAGDSLSIHNNMQFSTIDKDHDTWDQGSCARVYHGAWWFGYCHASDLNGMFYRGEQKTFADGVNWNTWRGLSYSLKSEMKIAPVD